MHRFVAVRAREFALPRVALYTASIRRTRPLAVWHHCCAIESGGAEVKASSRLGFAVCFLLASASSLQGQTTIAVVDEIVGPGLPTHGSSRTLLGAAPGAVTTGSDSLLFDIVPGAVSTRLVDSFDVPIDFDVTQAEWELRLRILDDNLSTGIFLTYQDLDGQQSEYWRFDFDISALTPADGWVTLRQDFLTNPLHVTPPATSEQVQNPGLASIQLQFGPPGRVHLELDYARIVTVPEPALHLVLATGLLAFGRFSMRRAKRDKTLI